MSAWVWFAGAILLGIAEVLGAEFVLLMLGGGALVTAGFALFFPELLWLQLLVFALASVALVLGLRPMLLRKYYEPSKIRTGIEAIIGSKATVVSTVDALGLRPMLLRKYYEPSKIRTGIEAIIGSKATVVSTVDADGGQVKIGGEVWSAVSLEGHRALPPGTSVTVVEVRGATAVVIWGP